MERITIVITAAAFKMLAWRRAAQSITCCRSALLVRSAPPIEKARQK